MMETYRLYDMAMIREGEVVGRTEQASNSSRVKHCIV